MAAALDIAIAQEDVKFGFTEVRLGVAPAIISVVCLPKMRRGEAMEAFLRGHRFPASRTSRISMALAHDAVAAPGQRRACALPAPRRDGVPVL